jgi:DNA repair protein RadC
MSHETRYHLRTVVWRFQESTEDLPTLKGRRSVFLRSPKDVVRWYGEIFTDHVRERFLVFWLDALNKVLGFEIVTEGILNSSLVHPREVFRGAIVATAAAVIIAHNHPSGAHEPSDDDLAITKQLVESGKTLGIPVQDHIIFTGSGYTSFAERGLI